MPQLKLQYSDKLVKVKLLTTKVIKVLCNAQFVEDGTLPKELLLCLSPDIDVDAVSIIDFCRIVFASWQASHGKQSYTAKFYCPECKCLNFAEHKMTAPAELDCYKSEQSIDAMSEDGQHTYKIKLRPLPLDFSLLHNLEGQLFSRIVSVDGKTDYDQDSIPMPVFTKIQELLTEELTVLAEYLVEKKPCSKCGATIEHSLSPLYSTFLQYI
jgi:hypothetical protein